MIYLQPGGDTETYLHLQALERIDLDALRNLDSEGEKPNLRRVLEAVERIVEEEKD